MCADCQVDYDWAPSAIFGLQEAINRAQASGGGAVLLDPAWSNAGGSDATITAATVYQKVPIEAAGSYNLTYQAPLTSTTCTLTTIETVTPACAVANATYGQTGSNAIISALTVNTAPLHLLATTASTTAAYIGTPSGRTTYAYGVHSTLGPLGIVTSQQAFAISPAPATTVPTVIGTIPIPIGFMNQARRTIEYLE